MDLILGIGYPDSVAYYGIEDLDTVVNLSIRWWEAHSKGRRHIEIGDSLPRIDTPPKQIPLPLETPKKKRNYNTYFPKVVSRSKKSKSFFQNKEDYRNNGKGWKKEEDDILIKYYDNKIPKVFGWLGAKLNRTPGAVSVRVSVLRKQGKIPPVEHMA